MRNYFENPSVIFSIAIILGLLLPSFSSSLEQLIIPALMLSMILSMREMRFKGGADFRENFSPSFKAFLLNYGALSGLILILGILFLFFGLDREYFYGFVIIAAIPPAVALVPFTYLLRGNFKISVIGEILCYVLSLFIAPLLIVSFIGTSIDIQKLLEILVLLILVPLLISRPLTRVTSEFFSKYTKTIVNLGIALVIYTIIGLNQPTLVSKPLEIMPLIFIVILRTFVIGTLVFLILRKIAKIKMERAISYTLFSVYKNCGAAAAIAISLLGAKSALPAAISSIFEISFLIYLKSLIEKF